eukprot:scaffold19960_cov46-Attheya_sp.AAC.2
MMTTTLHTINSREAFLAYYNNNNIIDHLIAASGACSAVRGAKQNFLQDFGREIKSIPGKGLSGGKRETRNEKTKCVAVFKKNEASATMASTENVALAYR